MREMITPRTVLIYGDEMSLNCAKAKRLKTIVPRNRRAYSITA